MKKDFLVVLGIVVLFFGVGYLVVSKNGVSYSLSNEEDKNESSVDVDVEDNIDLALDELDSFTFDEKITEYSLEEVYDSIFSLKNSEIKRINSEYVDIYVNFYDYFGEENVFYNMEHESYSYDEYKFVVNNHFMRSEKDVFAMFLATYSKCQVFSSFGDSYGEKYCKIDG